MNKGSFYTRVVHAGTHADEKSGAVMTPIYQTSTFVQSEPGVHKGWDYSRAGNPTRDAYEEALAALEGCSHALAFSSGLAAVQAVIQCIDPPAKVLVCDDVYGGTGRLFRKLFSKYNIEFNFVDMGDLELVREQARGEVAVIWVETPTNPTMKVLDIAALSQIAHDQGGLCVVDNTFASPMFQSPFDFGADIVLHSTTKYIGGHSDMIGGALMVQRPDLYEALKFVQFAAGAVPSPFECFLMQRSIKTLGVRMAKHQENAFAVAKFLSQHRRIKQMFFPGHSSHPQYELAKRQMKGHSGMISFDLDGGYQDVLKFLSKLKVFQLAESLGGVESLVNHPEKMTHASVPEELRKKLGIGPNLLRLSVGIEDAQDLIEDLDFALS